MLITVISQCHRGTLRDVRRLSLAPLNGLLIDIQHWLLNPHPPLNGLLVDIKHWLLNPHETRSLPQVGSWIQFTYRSTGNEYLIMPNSRALECELTSQSVKNHQPNHTTAGIAVQILYLTKQGPLNVLWGHVCIIILTLKQRAKGFVRVFSTISQWISALQNSMSWCPFLLFTEGDVYLQSYFSHVWYNMKISGNNYVPRKNYFTMNWNFINRT